MLCIQVVDDPGWKVFTGVNRYQIKTFNHEACYWLNVWYIYSCVKEFAPPVYSSIANSNI